MWQIIERRAWVVATASAEVIALDGKTVRRSGSPASRTDPQPLASACSAWATDQRLVLAQAAVDAKANDLSVLPELLAQLTFIDQIVTIDAIGCQRALARQILDGGGDYVLALKENQPTLREEIEDCFAMASPVDDFARTVEKDLGRLEVRVCETIHDPAVMAWLAPIERGQAANDRPGDRQPDRGTHGAHDIRPVLPQQSAGQCRGDRRRDPQP